LTSCSRQGVIADSEWCSHVKLDHVRMAAAEWFDGISTEELMELGEHELLVLRAAAEALRHSEKAYVTVREVWEYCRLVCADGEAELRLSYEKTREIVHDLHRRGIIHVSKKGISIIGAAVRDLSKVIQTMEMGLGGEKFGRRS